MTRKTVHFSLLVMVIIMLIWSATKPKFGYALWTLEVLPSLIVLLIAILTYNRFRMTTFSYFIIALLSILTFIGGHYSYSEVPLFNWIKDDFNFERNHYDRFGHLLKGLVVILIRELLIRKTPLTNGKTTEFIAINISLAIGALYEILEWLSTKVPFAKSNNNDFLGMQGDKWDSQWDMFLILVGSIIASLLLTRLHNKMLDKFTKEKA